MIQRSLWLLLVLLGYPLTVSAQQVAASGSFTDVGFSVGGGPRLAFGEWSATEGDFFLFLNVIHLQNYSYNGIGLQASYTGDPGLDFFSLMARMELGLKKGRFRGRRLVAFNTPYLALMAGYGKGTLWDEAFIELYGTEDEVEVDISGIPLYASLGWRRIGRLGLNLEAIAGLTIIISEAAELPEGTAPSIIPGIGIRVGIGFDTFSYER